MRVGELAALTGVSVRSLRYYEQQGLIHPERTVAGHRVYTIEHQALVMQIKELFRAGFCSSVIQELLPAIDDPLKDENRLRTAFAAAQARLESEKHAIDTELARLHRLRSRLGLDHDTHVVSQDYSPASPAITFDHRDRRLR